MSETPPSPSSSTSSFLPTTTLLAIPDGPIPSSSKDARTHTISILGGYPTFPSLPASSSSKIPESITCKICLNSIPLLTQVYCPPEGGENDRNVYVFGCPRGSCQKREGSVRAFRASVLNEVYAADAAEQKAKREKEEKERKEREKINPFSAANGVKLGSGGLGGALFGGPNTGSEPSFNPFSTTVAPPTNAFSSLSLSTPTPSPSAMTKPSEPSHQGPSTPSKTYTSPFPAYLPAQYLTTFEEFLPADPNALAGDTASRVKVVSNDSVQGQGGKDSSASGQTGATEQWERVLPKGVDEVFERFLERLSRAEDGEGQVLRYDMGAVPLPYTSHSDLYKRLFKNSKQLGEEDDDDDEGVDAAFRKAYNPKEVVPPCERCGSERTFEMQLVPGLIAELKTEMLSLSGEKKVKKNRKQTEEERKRELAVLLGKASAKDLVKPGEGNAEGETEEDRLKSETGMEWGTVMVFGCENDCVGFGEEWVGVEWEEIQ